MKRISPPPEELDQLDANEALNLVMEAVEQNAQLAVNVRADTIEWGKVAIARIKAKAKAAKPKGEAKTKKRKAA